MNKRKRQREAVREHLEITDIMDEYEWEKESEEIEEELAEIEGELERLRNEGREEKKKENPLKK